MTMRLGSVRPLSLNGVKRGAGDFDIWNPQHSNNWTHNFEHFDGPDARQGRWPSISTRSILMAQEQRFEPIDWAFRRGGHVWKEFREFAIKGNVVDLAVGIIIGAAFTTIVTSLVNDVIMPPIGWALGGIDYSNYDRKS